MEGRQKPQKKGENPGLGKTETGDASVTVQEDESDWTCRGR